MSLSYSKAMLSEPQTNPTETEAEYGEQPRQYASYPTRDPRRQRIVLPFDPRPVDLGTWTYEHKVGLCVVIIAYLIFGIIFLTTKLVVGVTPPEQNTIYLDMVPTPTEQQTPEERHMSEEELAELLQTLMSGEDASYEGNLASFGYADLDDPSEISIYPLDSVLTEVLFRTKLLTRQMQ